MSKNKIYVATASIESSVTSYLVLADDKKDAEKKVKKGFLLPERNIVKVTVDKANFHKGLFVFEEIGGICKGAPGSHKVASIVKNQKEIHLGIGKEVKPKKLKKKAYPSKRTKGFRSVSHN